MKNARDCPPSSPNDSLHALLRQVPAFRALVRSVECRLFERLLPLEPPVLDLGCGDGSFGSVLFDARPVFAGVDPDASGLREAAQHQVYRHLVAANGAHLPFPNDFFGTVMSNSVLEHIPDVDTVLGEVSRVLRPGGGLLFTVPSHRFGEMLLGSALCRRAGLGRAARAYADWFNRHSAHFHTDPPETWLVRLERCGFQLSSWEYYFTPASHRVFDLAHYLSLPSLLTRKLTGQWVLFPDTFVRRLFERWFRRYAEQTPVDEGPYLFFQARKAARG